MGARWGSSVEEAKKAVDQDSIEWFQDKTDQPPYVLYASGTSLDAPVIFSYFFTPRSKRLYKVTLTFNNPGLYGRARSQLVQKFREPSFTGVDVEHWSWKDNSLIILQKDASTVQVSYWSGPFLVLNREEEKGPVKQ